MAFKKNLPRLLKPLYTNHKSNIKYDMNSNMMITYHLHTREYSRRKLREKGLNIYNLRLH